MSYLIKNNLPVLTGYHSERFLHDFAKKRAVSALLPENYSIFFN